MPAVNTSAPAAAAAELAKVGARPCTTWDRLLQQLGVARDCLKLPDQQPAGPGWRLAGAAALLVAAVGAGWALGVFEEGP